MGVTEATRIHGERDGAGGIRRAIEAAQAADVAIVAIYEQRGMRRSDRREVPITGRVGDVEEAFGQLRVTVGGKRLIVDQIISIEEAGFR
jgi:hypothetical protein